MADECSLRKARATFLRARKAAMNMDAAQLESCLHNINAFTDSLMHRQSLLEPMRRLSHDAQCCVSSLGKLLTTSSCITPSRSLSNKGRLLAVCELDYCFGSLVYTCVSTGSAACSLSDLLHVRTESSPLLGQSSEGRRVCNEFRQNHLANAPETHARIAQSVKGDSKPNMLLALHRAIWRESLLIAQSPAMSEGRLWSSPTGKRRSKRQKRSRKKESEGSRSDEPLCPGHMTQTWWDTIRRWPCHLLAYAVPNKEALSVLALLAPIVEIGAGTGLWISLLQARGVDAHAIDICPPEGHNGGKNKFHGQAQAFCNVRNGAENLLRSHANATLLLCYPPNDTTMGAQAIQEFEGSYVVHVGEFHGDTGGRKLEQKLVWSGQFALERVIHLPNFPNTHYHMTVWRRQNVIISPSSPPLCPFVCSSCGTSAKQLKRCAWCRAYAFCTADCCKAKQSEHSVEHASRLIFIKMESERDFNDSYQYRLVDM